MKPTLTSLVGQTPLNLTLTKPFVGYPMILPTGETSTWPVPTRNGKPPTRLIPSTSPRGTQLAAVLKLVLHPRPHCPMVAVNTRLTKGPTIPEVAPIFGRQGPRPQPRLAQNTCRRKVPIRPHSCKKKDPELPPITPSILLLALVSRPNRRSYGATLITNGLPLAPINRTLLVLPTRLNALYKRLKLIPLHPLSLIQSSRKCPVMGRTPTDLLW